MAVECALLVLFCEDSSDDGDSRIVKLSQGLVGRQVFHATGRCRVRLCGNRARQTLAHVLRIFPNAFHKIIGVFVLRATGSSLKR